MKSLETILSSVEGLRELRGDSGTSVPAIRYDSRAVRPGDTYVALNGRDDRGLEYLPAAVEAGAAVVVVDAPERISGPLADTAGSGGNAPVLVVVDDARLAMARMAEALYDHPSRHLRIHGVTGTNGKTTTTYMLHQLLEAAGERVGIIGTLGKYMGGFIPTGYTTPEAPELSEILDEMVRAGCGTVAMEVSSHALALHRTAGIDFHGAIFTNLTQDHLDFHQSMQEYHDAKKLLFDQLRPGRAAVVNIDDLHGESMAVDCHAALYRYGRGATADAHIAHVAVGAEGSSWEIRLSDRLGGVEVTLRSPMVGAFNVSNVTAAFTLGLALGHDRELMIDAVGRLRAVPGRMESMALGNGATAVVDYAHTPDALENVLATLRGMLAGGSLTVVFGCGGDRDRAKRPVMGRIAADLADRIIVTSDNPRSEDPEAIIDQVVAGIGERKEAERIADRAAAIERALKGARAGDVVLIAGKGHENYQIVGSERIDFDDRDVVRAWIARNGGHLQQAAAA